MDGGGFGSGHWRLVCARYARGMGAGHGDRLACRIGGSCSVALAGDRTHLVGALAACGLLLAFGTALTWSRSEMVGAEPFEQPIHETFRGRALERIEQPAQDRVRLVLAARHPDAAEPVKIRVNVPLEADRPVLGEHAVIEVQARLMPPASPMLPGGYDFARTAWFAGFSATGIA